MNQVNQNVPARRAGVLPERDVGSCGKARIHGTARRLKIEMVRCLLLFTVAAAGLHAQDASPKLLEIPLAACSGLPCVTMQSGSGQTVRLLIDLAQANAYLDTKAAQALGLDLKPLAGDAASAVSGIQQAVVPGAKLGDLPLGDFPFMVLDTTPQPTALAKSLPPLPADGALTYRSFQNRILEFDFAARVLRISEPQTDIQPCPSSCTQMAIKHFGQFGPVTLTEEGFEVNGQPVDAQVDTLFTGTMLIYPKSVEKLGLKRVKKGKAKDFFPFTQGGIELLRTTGASESYRGISLLADAPLYFTPSDEGFPKMQFDATIGLGLLSQAVVTFDFKAMRMWLTKGH
jgi:hypothetical protein